MRILIEFLIILILLTVWYKWTFKDSKNTKKNNL